MFIEIGCAGAKSLRQVFGAKGITIDNVAKSGSTAEQWARQPNSLRDAVRKNPDAKWVWLTIGGLLSVFVRVFVR